MLQSSVTRWHFIGAFIVLGICTAGLGFLMYGLVSDESYEPTLPPVPARAGFILDYWLGNADGHINISEERLNLWSQATSEQAQEIGQQFVEDAQKAVQGEYADWLRHPRGRLAMIILLLDFSQYMDDGKTMLDKQQRSLELALDGIRKNQDIDLTLIERVFFYQPLSGSESLEMQNRSVGLYERLHEIAPIAEKEFFLEWFNQAKEKREVIYMFGRFPERNELLGRESTAQEKEYLERQGR